MTSRRPRRPHPLRPRSTAPQPPAPDCGDARPRSNNRRGRHAGTNRSCAARSASAARAGRGRAGTGRRSPARDPNSPIGVWSTEENKGNVRIEECGANLCGYSVKTGERS